MTMQTYEGGCHCKAIRYTAAVDLDQALACNCSRCSTLGLILTFTSPDQFQITSGSDADLTDYRFNKHVIHHLFCKKCGVESFARGQTPDGTSMVAINVRCLDGVDPASLHPHPYDGRSA